MPRAAGRYTHFFCLTCNAVFRGLWYAGDPELVDKWNRGTLLGFQSSLDGHNPDCAQPHIAMGPSVHGWMRGTSNAQVCASQRAVVYQFPDGTWSQPGTNDPMDPIAQDAIRDGAVRREFYHVRDMHDFQRSLRKTPTDELSGYNDVVDFDEAARQQRDTQTMDMERLHVRESRLRDAFESLGVRGNQGRYEAALQALRERGYSR